MNYQSSHPISQKRDILTGMVDRTVLLSSPKFHYKNIKFIINTLLNNDYPIDFIFNTIDSRLKLLFRKLMMKWNHIVTINKYSSWFILPYVSTVSEKFFFIKNIYSISSRILMLSIFQFK